jgi:hypothetical protein
VGFWRVFSLPRVFWRVFSLPRVWEWDRILQNNYFCVII